MRVLWEVRGRGQLCGLSRRVQSKKRRDRCPVELAQSLGGSGRSGPVNDRR